MAITGRFAIAGYQQVEGGNDASHAQIKMAVNRLLQRFCWHGLRTKGVDSDGKGAGQADGPSQLDFTARRKPSGDDVFRHMAGGVGGGTVYLRRVFTGKCPSAVTGRAAIGVDDDFSANVSLVGYELSHGNGMVTVKLKGEVGAINAAVEAAIGAASRVGHVYAHKVIARTAQRIEDIIYSRETVGVAQPEPEAPAAASAPQAEAAPSLAIPVVTLATTDFAPCRESANEAAQTPAEKPFITPAPGEIVPAKTDAPPVASKKSLRPSNKKRQ